MDIKLQSQENLHLISPCLVQLYEGYLYTQGLVGVGDTELYFYNDNQPDLVEEDVAYYLVKRIVDFVEISRFEYGKPKNNPQLKHYSYIKIMFVDESHPLWIYYTKADKKRIKKIINTLKSKGLINKHKNIDLMPVF